MKTLLLSLLLFAGVKGMGQDTAYVNYKDSTGEYLIEYTYDGRWCTVPATMNGEPHYQATVRVFKMIKNKRIQIGEVMNGQYVPSGCFEDIPANWISVAINNEKDKKKLSKKDTVTKAPPVIWNLGWKTNDTTGKQINIRYRQDTIRVIMQLCDTSYQETRQHSFPVDSGRGSWTIADRNDRMWWQFGYVVRQEVSGWRTPGFDHTEYTDRLGRSYEYIDTLTEDKKPLPSFIYVWEVREIKLSATLTYGATQKPVPPLKFTSGIIGDESDTGTVEGDKLYHTTPTDHKHYDGLLYLSDLCKDCRRKVKAMQNQRMRSKIMPVRKNKIKQYE